MSKYQVIFLVFDYIDLIIVLSTVFVYYSICIYIVGGVAQVGYAARRCMVNLPQHGTRIKRTSKIIKSRLDIFGNLCFSFQRWGQIDYTGEGVKCLRTQYRALILRIDIIQIMCMVGKRLHRPPDKKERRLNLRRSNFKC